MATLYRYSVRYRSKRYPPRIVRVTLLAANPDEARARAELRDPDYGAPYGYPKRRGTVLLLDPCRFCKRSDPIADGLYQRVSFPDGIANVCDDCFDRSYDEDRYATWRDTEVEVA